MPGFHDPAGSYILADAEIPANSVVLGIFTPRWRNGAARPATNTRSVTALDASSGSRLTPPSPWAPRGAVIALVGALEAGPERFHNGACYLSLDSGRLVAHHGRAHHYPF